MKNILIIFFISISFILFNGCGIKNWSNHNKFLATTLITGQTINYGQANYVLKKDNWNERSTHINQIYNNGSSELVFLYKIISTATILYVADRFEKYRTTILTGANAITYYFIISDSQSKVGIKF